MGPGRHLPVPRAFLCPGKKGRVHREGTTEETLSPGHEAGSRNGESGLLFGTWQLGSRSCSSCEPACFLICNEGMGILHPGCKPLSVPAPVSLITNSLGWGWGSKRRDGSPFPLAEEKGPGGRAASRQQSWGCGPPTSDLTLCALYLHPFHTGNQVAKAFLTGGAICSFCEAWSRAASNRDSFGQAG